MVLYDAMCELTVYVSANSEFNEQLTSKDPQFVSQGVVGTNI